MNEFQILVGAATVLGMLLQHRRLAVQYAHACVANAQAGHPELSELCEVWAQIYDKSARRIFREDLPGVVVDAAAVSREPGDVLTGHGFDSWFERRDRDGHRYSWEADGGHALAPDEVLKAPETVKLTVPDPRQLELIPPQPEPETPTAPTAEPMPTAQTQPMVLVVPDNSQPDGAA